MILEDDGPQTYIHCENCSHSYWADACTEEGTTWIIRVDGTVYLMPQCPKCKSLEFQTVQEDVACLI